MQNPHFYVDLPKSPTRYGDSFSSQPTEIYKGTIYVLTNNLDLKFGDSRRVFFEFGGKPRAFDNFWDTNNTLIFKGGDRMSLLLPSLTCFQMLLEDSRVKRSSKDQSQSTLNSPSRRSRIVWFICSLRQFKSKLQNTHRIGGSRFANC